ncbi:MAG: hypothetical protein MUE32_01875 [Bacteroidales bacterium]|jgi:hypothetical protein|nr:hypothetical protein [Bacteroidales bacterium]
MRLKVLFPVIALLLAAGVTDMYGQCKSFAKKVCIPELGVYVHDGNYHAAVLVEGEEAELYKTFYSDMKYRVAIVGEENLSNIEFKVLDASRNVIYSNKDANYAKTWDFELQSSQQLKLVVKVPEKSKSGETPASGCVSIMFGFKLKN